MKELFAWVGRESSGSGERAEGKGGAGGGNLIEIDSPHPVVVCLAHGAVYPDTVTVRPRRFFFFWCKAPPRPSGGQPPRPGFAPFASPWFCLGLVLEVPPPSSCSPLPSPVSQCRDASPSRLCPRHSRVTLPIRCSRFFSNISPLKCSRRPERHSVQLQSSSFRYSLSLGWCSRSPKSPLSSWYAG